MLSRWLKNVISKLTPHRERWKLIRHISKIALLLVASVLQWYLHFSLFYQYGHAKKRSNQSRTHLLDNWYYKIWEGLQMTIFLPRLKNRDLNIAIHKWIQCLWVRTQFSQLCLTKARSLKAIVSLPNFIFYKYRLSWAISRKQIA